MYIGIRPLVNLGVEPLTKGLNANYLLTHMQGKNVAIKQAIMDQCIVVGVGNIYAGEDVYGAYFPMPSIKKPDAGSSSNFS